MLNFKIPNSWVLASIENVAEVKGGKRLPQGKTLSDQRTNFPYLRVTDFNNGSIDASNLKYLDAETQNLIKQYTISSEDLYISIAGTIGLVGEIPVFLNGANLTENAAKLCNLNGVLKPYLKYVLNSNGAIEQFEDKMTSSGQPKLALFRIKDCIFPLPPLAEQKVIADKLDTLLAQVETTKARLKRIPEILKSFRQSVLAAAVSGKLTEEWRRINKLESDNWKKTNFSEICKEITVGFVGKMADRYQQSGIPFLRSQNVRAFQYSDINLLYISEEFHKEIYKSRLEAGDLAIVRSGAPGTTCVIPEDIGVANCSDLVIARPGDCLNSKFGCIYMNSEVAQKNVSENQVGVAQQHFNVGSMKKMPINLPSLSEQAEIVRRVEELFAFADRIEQAAQAAQSRVNNLTQSILAKAFRGELTADWRIANPDLISGDNSAEALLAKIKIERAKVKTRKKD